MIDFGSLFTLPPGHGPAGIAGLTLLHFLWQGAVIAAIQNVTTIASGTRAASWILCVTGVAVFLILPGEIAALGFVAFLTGLLMLAGQFIRGSNSSAAA